MTRHLKTPCRALCLAGVIAVAGFGCASPQLMLDRTMILNATDGTVRAVSVLHEPTLETGSANAILPGRSFQLGFDREPLRAQYATVRWLDQRGVSNKVSVAIPEVSACEGVPMELIYTIRMDGRISVEFRPSQGHR
ncbi:MAG: hypothetical protein HN919_18675 [Verrucomicrobia bacterium]|jgi:hypothetical protein|nr:hypothetical protein [Verrucomicrobiota bacterium]MBT7068329.1 hypothetical protein [Verrucomicrobiota bacterium]MBT7699859.1 hypothetical protein [Verrucomicrobiota bacterium]